jgi:hypothetical protein
VAGEFNDVVGDFCQSGGYCDLSSEAKSKTENVLSARSATCLSFEDRGVFGLCPD